MKPYPVSPSTAAAHGRGQTRIAGFLSKLAALSMILLPLTPALGQIQRSTVNLGFEQPTTAATSCYFTVGGDAINGWSSSAPAPGAGPGGANVNTYCPPPITATTPGVNSGGQIEVWTNSYNGVPALEGAQLAELNAYYNSRLFQTICLVNGDVVGFSLGHRGRQSDTVGDIAEFNIDAAGNTVVRASTTNTGVGGLTACGGTLVAPTNGPVSGTTENGVGTPTCSSATAPNGWRRYSGSFTWVGTTANHSVGFESVSTSTGDPSYGNLIDEVSVTLRPVIEFAAANYSSREGGTVTQPQIIVVGTVPAGGVPVLINAAGTATSGADYTLGTYTIPAGVYTTPTTLTLTGLVNLIDDSVIENNETLVLTIAPSPTNYTIANTNICGNVGTSTSTYTILDNDVDVLTTKSVANANPPAGGTATFTVTYRNNTARPTVGSGTDLNVHDASVNLADALPAGFSAFGWTCAASGTPLPTCPAASGTGAIGATATLPAGSGAAGGTLTYTVTGTLDPSQCAAATNTSTVALTSGLGEGTSAQAGFVTPAPGGAANNSASVVVDPRCLTLSKTTLGDAGGPFNFTLANTTQAAGTATTATAGTAVTVDGNNAVAGTQPFGISAAGTAISIAESALPAGYAINAASCANGATVVGSLSGSTYTIPAASVTGGADFTCAFLNQRMRTVTLNKVLPTAGDSGLFTLRVDGSAVASNVGNGGSGSTSVAVGSGVTVNEIAGTATMLSNYASSLACAGVAGVSGTTSGGFTMPNADVSCTFTNSPIVNLAVSKQAMPSGSYLPGQPLNYTIVVTNNGPAAASGISVSDTVPATVSVSGWTCSAAGAGADCDTTAAGTGASGSGNAISLNAVALGAGQNITITVTGTVQLSATGSIVNTATATPPAGATCTTPPCGVTGTATNTNGGAAQLSVAKSASPASFAVGQAGTYTVQVSNSGSTSTSGAIVINDPLPAGITTTALPSGAGWDCSASTSTVVSCATAAVLLPGSNAPPITIPVVIAAGTASPAVNTATGSGGGDSSCPAATHCQGTTTTAVNAPRLDVTKVLQGNFVVGVPASYVISVTNNGQADTLAGTITDTIPAGLTLGTLPAGCTAIGQDLTCNLPAGISAGATISFTIPVTPQPSTSGQSLTNSATANGGGDPTCPAAAHCTGSTTDTVNAPQLSIVKSATPSTFVIGVQGSYTLTVTNTGTAATTAATTVSDTVPGGLTLGTLPAGCSAAGQLVTCTIAAGLATNTPVSFSIPVTPQSSLSGLSVTNTATATGGGDPSCPTGSGSLPPRCSSSTTTAISAPELTITKTASGSSFVVGVPASYTLQVTNTGTAATTATATISDTVPADLVIGSLPADCSAAAQVVTCTIPAGLATGTPVSFTIPVTPTAAASGNTLSNSASVSGGGDPTCPGATHCTSSVQTPVDAPQLTLSKSASAANFVVGVPASYVLQVSNSGSAATTAVATVSDTIPGSLAVGAMPAGCSAAGQVVTCTIPAGLAVGATATFTIPVTPTPAANGTTVTNTATVSGGGDPTCPAAAHCSSTTNTPVDAPQLTIVKSASASNFVVGVPASYMLTVTNSGSAATTATATVSDSVPATLTLGSLPADCTAAGQSVSCTVAAGLAVGASVTFTIPVTPMAAASGTTVTNTATVSGGGDPTCPGATHCSSTTNTPVDAPQLTLTKTASAANFVVGVPASYTLQISNTGTAATTADATVSDTVPASLTPGTPLPAGCSAAGQAVSCTVPAGLAVGANVSFAIPVTPAPAASGTTVINTATVSGGGDSTCPAATHCSSTTNTPVDAPQLTIVKSASASNFVVGVPASYTLQVTNTGTAATTAVATVSDTIPASLTPGAAPAGCTITGPSVSCTIPAGLATGANVSFVIPVTPTAAASGTSVVNTATVSGGGDANCPAAANCSSTTNTPVDAPQLTIIKSASAGNFVVSVPASYTLQVTNTGTAATTAAASVSDTIPASLTPGAVPAGCTITGQNVSCTIASGLAVGANVSFVIPVTPTAAASGTTVVNTATVGGGGDPTCPAATHCSSTTNTPVNAPQLTLVKTAGAPNFVVGVPASYTLQVTNTGTAATTADATVTDTIPASLTPGAAPAGCAITGPSVSCTIPAGLAVGANVSFVIPVTPTAAASGTIVVNTATVSGGGDPTCPAATQCSSTTNTPVDAPQLTIVKTASASSFVVGVPASYTLQVTNTGTAATTAVATISDTIPAALTPGAAPAGCTITGPSVSCTIPTGLAVGANVSFVIPVTPTAAAAGTTVINTGTVSGGGDPTCPAAATCSSTVQTPVEQIVNLSIAKTATPSGTYLPGQSLSYSIVVSNNGPSPANGISVTDTVPASVTVSAWTCTATGANADCDTTAAGTGATGSSNAFALSNVALGVGDSLTISISGTVQLSATGSIVNTATAAPPTAATCTTPPCSVTSTATNTDGGSPQLVIAKNATPGAFAVGQPATYTLQVSNSGSSSTSGVITVSDPLPAGITTTATPSGTGWNCSASTTTQVNCSTGTVLLPGSNAPVISVPVTIGVGTASPAVNTATTSGGGDASCPAAAHCQSTTTTPVNAPRLDVTKVLQGNFVVGEQSNYVITVTNNGQADTLAGTITDTIPSGLTLGVMPPGCTSAGQNVTCNLPAGISAGTSISYTIPVTPTAALIGQSVTNSATVNDGGDPTCPAEAHCTGTTTNTVEAPQLSITKSATPTTFVIGVQATYTLTVTNTGTAATTAVTTVSDTVPSGLVIGTLPVDCSATGQVITCTIAAGLATGTPVSFTIPVTPQPSLSGLSVTNTATATGGGDPSCPAGAAPSALPPRCVGTATTPVDAPELTITKTASGSNFVVGVPASYTLQVTNTGTAATTAAATVSDTIPADLILGTLPPDCSATGQVVTCTINSGFAVGSTVSFVIPVTPTAAASGQTLTNTASVSGGGDPSCPGAAHCTSTVQTPVDAPQLTLVKSASASNFVVGVAASYTLTVTNSGTAATTAAATISDTIPGTLTIGTPLPAGCSAAGQVITCTIAAGLAVGANASFVIPVTPTAAASGTTVVNTATVSGGGDPTCPAATHCSSTTNTPVDAPQLTIVKSASASSFVVGVAASYTLQVTNTGTAATTAAATVSDTIPADLIIGTPLPSGCSTAGQTISCTILAGLATGAPVSFTIPVTPTAAANGQTLTNTATVSGGGDPTCPTATHCTSTVQTPVDAPQLTILKSASASSFVVGVPASYTLQVTNTGTAATTAVATVSDTIPASLTPGAAPAGCTITGPSVSCTIPTSLAVGASVSFVIPVTPTAAAAGTTVVNTGTVSGGGDPTCPAAVHCSSTVQTPVELIVNLTIAKTATPNGSYLPGQPLNYSIVVSNTGPSPASGISVSDTVPASVTVSAWTCTATGTNADCDTTAAGTGATGSSNAIALSNVALGVGDSLTISITGTVQPSATGSIVNTATAAPPTGATCTTPPCSVTSTATNTDGGSAQLTLAKNAIPAAFAVGQPATYTLQVSNTGSSSTAGVISINDPLPPGITTTAAPSGTGWDCSASTATVVNCTTSTVLLPGSNAPVISVPVAIGVGTASPAVNTATTSGGGDASCPADTHCMATTITPVNAPRLDVTKLLQGNFVVGVQSNYVITVSNNGQADTLAGTVTDTIPTGLTLGAMPPGCTSAGQNVTCNLPAGISAGTSISYTIPVTPTAALIGQSVTNSATANGGGDPTCPADAHCTGTTTNTVQAPQLSITKSATPSAFVVGVAASYTLTVTNTGTVATTAATTVSDTVPTGLVIGALPAACSAAGQAITCTIAAGLATGTPVSFTIPVTPQPSLSGLSVTNTATATGGGDPSCPLGTDPSTLPPRCVGTTTTAIDAPELTITKTASASNFVVGVPASYTLQVTNTGTAATTAAATVSDAIPADLIIGTPLPVACSASGQQISCTIASGFAVGANVAFVIPVTPTAAASGQTLTNTAHVSGGGDSSCPIAAHCTSTVQTPVDAPQLSIVKTASASNFVIGVPASYTLTVTNTGSAATTAAATVSDTIPASLTIGTPLPAGCTAAGQAITCTIATGFAVGANVAFTIPVTATPAASGTTVVNTATVSGGGDSSCPAAAHCSSTVQTPVDAPLVSIAKTASSASFSVGVPASYTLTVTNLGSAATTEPTIVTDPIPASLGLGAPLPADCSAAGQIVTCTIAAGLAPNSPVAFTIPVTPTAAAAGTSVVNTATVSGNGCRGDGCSSTVQTPVDAAQLSLVKTASAAAFQVGVPASYTLTLSNTGTAATLTASAITDPVPAGLDLGAMPAGCTAAVQLVTCTVPAGFAAGASVSFVIPVTPNASAGALISNTASVNGDGCPGAPGCSSTVDVPTGNAADLSVSKTDGGVSVQPGNAVSYTLTVRNDGPSPAIASTLADPTPPGLGFVSATAPCSGGFPCNLGDLAAGASVVVTVTYQVPATYSGPQPISNTASISSSTPDPNAGNNSATDTTPLLSAPPPRVQPVPALGLPGLLALAGLLGLAARTAQRRRPALLRRDTRR